MLTTLRSGTVKFDSEMLNFHLLTTDRVINVKADVDVEEYPLLFVRKILLQK
jgi:hypothetical protein